MAGADIRRFSSDRRGVGVNVLMGIASGGVAALAETLILPRLLLAYFVAQLTSSYLAVGWVAAIATGVWALSRLPAAVLISPRQRSQPWALAAALIQAAAMGLLAFVTYGVAPEALAASQSQLLRSFFICFVVFVIAGGFASIPMGHLLAKATPNGLREALYHRRSIAGLIGAAAGALVVFQLLREGGPVYPRQFALLFLAATVCQVAIAVLIASMREPIRVSMPRGSTPLAAVQALPRALADSSFRRFFVFRIMLSLAAIADPFLILFALARLGAPVSAAGVYIVAFVAGLILSRPLWAWLATRAGERASLQVCALLRFVPPLLALALPFVADSRFFQERFGDSTVLAWVFAAAFVCMGAAASGQARGNFGYLAEISPDRFRGPYAGILNSALMLVAFAPVAGGLLIERFGYEGLFAVAALAAFIGAFASGSLTNAFVRRRSDLIWANRERESERVAAAR